MGWPLKKKAWCCPQAWGGVRRRRGESQRNQTGGHSWPQADGFLDSLAEEWKIWKGNSSRKKKHSWGSPPPPSLILDPWFLCWVMEGILKGVGWWVKECHHHNPRATEPPRLYVPSGGLLGSPAPCFWRVMPDSTCSKSSSPRGSRLYWLSSSSSPSLFNE